jgi:hypothetical protein
MKRSRQQEEEDSKLQQHATDSLLVAAGEDVHETRNEAETGEEEDHHLHGRKVKKSRTEPSFQSSTSSSGSISIFGVDRMEVVPAGAAAGPASFDVPEEAKNIDMDLYSRQYYVYGGKAMTKMADSNVFLSGLGGLGIEIGTHPLACLTDPFAHFDCLEFVATLHFFP